MVQYRQPFAQVRAQFVMLDELYECQCHSEMIVKLVTNCAIPLHLHVRRLYESSVVLLCSIHKKAGRMLI